MLDSVHFIGQHCCGRFTNAAATVLTCRDVLFMFYHKSLFVVLENSRRVPPLASCMAYHHVEQCAYL